MRQHNAPSLYLAALAGYYIYFGLNDLIAPDTLSLTHYGGILVNPTLWGWSFVIVGVILSHALLRPDLRVFYRISLACLLSLTSSWLVVRTIVALSKGRDYTSIGSWLLLLIIEVLVIMSAENDGHIHLGVQGVGQWIRNAAVSLNARRTRPKRHAGGG